MFRVTVSPKRLYGAVAACSIIVYLGALWNRFAVDDLPIIVLNPLVTDPSGMWRTFAAPYWGAYRADEQPDDPTAGSGNPMHKIMGDLYAQGALVLHGEQEFTYHRTPVAGDVLDGLQKITDIYEKETDRARMTFIVMETEWTDAETSEPVVTERFNLIARLKK